MARRPKVRPSVVRPATPPSEIKNNNYIGASRCCTVLFYNTRATEPWCIVGGDGSGERKLIILINCGDETSGDRSGSNNVIPPRLDGGRETTTFEWRARLKFRPTRPACGGPFAARYSDSPPPPGNIIILRPSRPAVPRDSHFVFYRCTSTRYGETVWR